jgi:hypothetical protein
MQFTQAHALKKGFGITALAIKIIVLLACVLFMFSRFSEIQSEVGSLVVHFQKGGQFLVLGAGVILLLVPCNWFLEVSKWKGLTRKIHPLSTLEATQSVLAGITFGFLTPRAIGDYFGRMLTFHHRDKAQIILPLMVGRLAQLIPTVFFGFFGLYAFFSFSGLPEQLIIYAALLLLSAIGFLYGFASLRSFIGRVIPFSRYFLKGSISNRTVSQTIGISFLRYAVFTIQFVIAMMIFRVDAPAEILLLGIMWIFLAKSIVPSFSFLSDLGIREISAIIFFEALNVPIGPVVIASLFIWLLNIALPAIIGLLAIQRAKFW